MLLQVTVGVLAGLVGLAILAALLYAVLYGSFRFYRYLVYKIWRYSISESIHMIQRAAFNFERDLSTTHPEVKDLALKVTTASLLFESNRISIMTLILPLLLTLWLGLVMCCTLPLIGSLAVAFAQGY